VHNIIIIVIILFRSYTLGSYSVVNSISSLTLRFVTEVEGGRLVFLFSVRIADDTGEADAVLYDRVSDIFV
jgi:hypothetical protein